MRRISQWVISGLVTMVLWAPMAGAQEGDRAWHERRQDRTRGAAGQWTAPQNMPSLGQERRPDPAQRAPIDQNARQYGWQDRNAQPRERHGGWQGVYQDRQDMRRDWRNLQQDRYQLWQDRRDHHRGAIGNDRARLRQDRNRLRHDRHEMRYDWSRWPQRHYHRW